MSVTCPIRFPSDITYSVSSRWHWMFERCHFRSIWWNKAAFTSLHNDTMKTISISAAFTSLHYDSMKTISIWCHKNNYKLTQVDTMKMECLLKSSGLIDNDRSILSLSNNKIQFCLGRTWLEIKGVPVKHIFSFGRSKMEGGNDILQNVGACWGWSVQWNF